MLPERLSRLLTGLVDGQLSATEEKQALELLRRSAEARELFQQLKADAQLLAELPRLLIPAGFSEQLEASLPTRPVRIVAPTRNSGRKLKLRVPAIYAAAASLLLALGIAYFQKSDPKVEPAHSNLAQGNELPVLSEGGRLQEEPLPAPRTETLSPARTIAGPPTTNSARPEVLANMPRPEPDVLTAPVTDPATFKVPDPKAPLILTMSEIDQQASQGRVTEELSQAKSWRLDLKCLESEVATIRLKRALQQMGISLLIDPDATDRQRLRFARTSYAVLIENVSPAECLSILTELRKVDRQEQMRSRTSNQFFDIKLARQSPEDGSRLEELFGFKTGARESVKSVPAEVNSRDAGVMAAARAAAIWRDQNPEGQGAPRQALLVAEVVGRVRKPSNEYQLYLNSRQTQKPALLQLMIVLTPRRG